MYGLLLTLVLTQAPPSRPPGQGPATVLLLERGTELSRKRGQVLATQVSALLVREGLSMVVAPEEVARHLEAAGASPVAACQGQRACLARLGQGLGAELVVRLEAVALVDTLGLHLEALSVNDGSSLLDTAFVVTAGEREELEAQVTAFATRLRARLVPRAPARDAPQVEPGPRLTVPRVPLPELEPAARPRLPEAALPSAPPRRSRSLAYVTGSGALAAAGAALSFGLLGLNGTRRLEDAASSDPETGLRSSSLPRSEAKRLTDQANLAFTLALSSAMLSAVLGAATVWLWVEEPPAR